MTLRMKICVGGSPDDVTRQYRAWRAAQPVAVNDTPEIKPRGRGWILTVYYQEPVHTPQG